MSDRQLLEYVAEEVRNIREKQEQHSVAIAEVKTDVKHLRGKVAGISSFIGVCFGYVFSFFTSGHK